MLQEMDDEFGVGDIVKSESKKADVKPKQKRPPGAKRPPPKSDLAGLTVKHAKETFTDGTTTILVLDDKSLCLS